MEILHRLKLRKIKKLLAHKSQNIVIVSHRNPDGDAMGSSVALYNFLGKLGHKVNIVVPNAYPQFLGWMKGVGETLVFEKNKDKCVEVFRNCTILFTLDFNDLSRVREFAEYLLPVNCYKVLIDHHPEPGSFADFSVSDTSVSSTSELVYLFMKAVSKENIDKDIAEAVYVGIMTDTGCFSFNSSKKQTFDVVGELLQKNIDKDKVFGLVYNNYSIDRMRLLGHCLGNRMVYLPEFRSAYIWLTQDDIKRFNFKVGDSEGFVNLPLSVKGVVFSAFFTEREDIVKISLRSKGNFAVNSIAQRFYQGGGHPNAAGGESKVKLTETIETFVNILKEYKQELLDAE
ncbi:MAG: bifunctional oligoribonuclease/PAP phosphatase NrnA [Bacteroidales bacterium]|nr:bifunctional oligoribonuclease/PAP phosphatase NrnA [Bacteroidales bacterium]